MQVTAIPSNKPNLTFQALPSKFQKIDDFLIRGPHPSVCDIFQLKKEGVNQIYDFRHKSIRSIKFVEQITCQLLGIKYKRKPYSNLHGPYPHVEEFENVAKSVRQNGEQGGKTLFHCNSGRHRTAHMTAFYRLTEGKHTLKEVKENLGDKFKKTAIGILKSEVVHKGYYSRKPYNYNGYNPIKQVIAKINNRYVEAIRRGQEMFFKTVLGIK